MTHERTVRCGRKPAEAGFSLTELMVVVVIMGILSAATIPRFASLRVRSMQAEAKAGLNGIYLSMQAYQANYAAFPSVPTPTDPAIVAIGFDIAGQAPAYSYRIISSTNSWAASANSVAVFNGNAVVSRDMMRTNANKIACTVFDAVLSLPSTVNTARITNNYHECTQTSPPSLSPYVIAHVSPADDL